MKKKLPVLIPLTVWLLLSLIEVWSFFFQNPKPMYFRGWEYMLNTRKDASIMPFKPLSTYDGTSEGDLLKWAHFLATHHKHQYFVTDEYGFRNRSGLLQKPIDAGIIGTSLVGGASLSQKDLISDILIDKYHINTYNYAYLPLQELWEDRRFIEHKPKYVITIASEDEIIESTRLPDIIATSSATHTITKWHSEQEWEQKNPTPLSTDYIESTVIRYSLIRYMSDKLYLMTLNALFPKTLIAEVLDRDLRYESSNGYIYAYIQGIDTLYSESAKQKIEAKIHKLQLTRDLLHSRGIQYIIAVFPSKVDLYSNIYQGVPVENRSVYHLEKALSESGIEYIPLTKDAFNYKPTTGRYLYPPDDAHWNEDADQLIASQIAAKIHELETNP